MFALLIGFVNFSYQFFQWEGEVPTKHGIGSAGASLRGVNLLIPQPLLLPSETADLVDSSQILSADVR